MNNDKINHNKVFLIKYAEFAYLYYKLSNCILDTKYMHCRKVAAMVRLHSSILLVSKAIATFECTFLDAASLPSVDHF